MKSQSKIRDLITARSVHPRAIRNHGLFGATFVKQHQIIDEKWSMGDLIDEFHGMANLLSKGVILQNLINKGQRKQFYECAHNLRIQCRDGRIKLQNILNGKNVKAIHKHLLNYKEKQRLYQNLPVKMVLENIDQCTFLMRKERDRLTHRLKQLQQEYEYKLLERANIENRIKYENEFVLEEENKSAQFLENLYKSKVRVKAIRAIYSTYNKILQVLSHDELFFEPILRSLSKDIDDQSNFIKHILYLGTPALAEFKTLSEQYRIMAIKSRKSTHTKFKTFVTFNKISSKQEQTQPSASKANNDLVVNISKRYGRETKSMLKLKTVLEDIETIIKEVKMVTLCTSAKEIFPRFRSQNESNYKLNKENDTGQKLYDFSTFKEKLAAENRNILLHNYSQEEEKRLLRIKLLEQQIKEQDVREEEILSYLKNRAGVFVIVRYSLWNLSNILRHVGPSPTTDHIKYPNSYLKLPLLIFEMQTMRSSTPDYFEEDTKLLLTSVEKKLRTLMEYFSSSNESEPKTEPFKAIEELWEEYHEQFLAMNATEEQQQETKETPLPRAEDLFEDSNTLQHVPSRRQIKLESAKLVEEELSKKED